MIRLQIGKKTLLKRRKRLRNKARQRKKIFGTSQRPRLVVFRSSRHIYAQVINDSLGKVVAQVSTLKSRDLKESGCVAAERMGKELARQAKNKKVDKIVFDRNGFIYHGRIKALAQGARSEGLIF